MPLITFEGIDGSGKSTQIKRLTNWLESNQCIQPHVFREPGGTTLSEQIRTTLLDTKQHILPVTELLLFSAARAQLVEEKVRPLLEQSAWVILDRFFDSTTAYQGYGRNVMNVEQIQLLNRIAVQNLEPDITFFLDIDWHTSLKRRHTNKPDRMESGGDEFFQRVVEGYRKIASNEARIMMLDGRLEEEILNQQIIRFLSNTFSLK